MDKWYYICDACGSIVTITDSPIAEDEEWECSDCTSTAMWEFTRQAPAMEHSRHIQALVRSGFVRKVTT